MRGREYNKVSAALFIDWKEMMKMLLILCFIDRIVPSDLLVRLLVRSLFASAPFNELSMFINRYQPSR